MTYGTIIIDDEIRTIDGLETFIKHTGLPVKILGRANNVMDGVEVLKQTDPFIVFLDVEMPFLNGFDFLKLVDKSNKYFIFLTPHEEYAFRAIKNNINDYLLKPLSFADVRNALEKAIAHYQHSARVKKASSRIVIPTATGTLFKEMSDILYIKAQKRYSLIVCQDGSSHLVCKNIGGFEEELDPAFFYRVHKSFLINCKHVRQIHHTDGGFVEISNGDQIEISVRRKAQFIRHMRP